MTFLKLTPSWCVEEECLAPGLRVLELVVQQGRRKCYVLENQDRNQAWVTGRSDLFRSHHTATARGRTESPAPMNPMF